VLLSVEWVSRLFAYSLTTTIAQFSFTASVMEPVYICLMTLLDVTSLIICEHDRRDILEPTAGKTAECLLAGEPLI
jgi:hypothetical protein